MVNHLVSDLREIAEGLREDPTEWPHIPCPTCRRGRLLLVDGSLVMEVANTSKAHEHVYQLPDPGWVYGGFHGMLKCLKSSCDLVRVVGFMGVWEPGPTSGYQTMLTPTQFLPALPLLENAALCPKKALARVNAAATILWLDPSSAANRLRSATEALMDAQGIAGGGTLHARIELFRNSKPEVADLLLAVKWVGNVGSHSDVLGISDVLDGAEILDDALRLLYDTSSAKIAQKAAQITARKGVPGAYSARPPF